MLLGQITDTHVIDPDADYERYVDNNALLSRAIAAANEERPSLDAVLMTGDLVNTGHPREYELLAELVAEIDRPVLALPGNHDTRDGVRATFPDLPWADADHASWVTDVGDVTIVGLDSTIPGLPGAEIDDERATWLEAALAGAGDRVVLALHHPPFASGIQWMDRSGFIGLDRLVDVLHRHPVERILCGHLHRSMQSAVAGVPTVVAPSTVQHVDLDLADDAPVSLILDPVGYAIHHVTDNGWVTHTRWFDTGAERIHPSWG